MTKKAKLHRFKCSCCARTTSVMEGSILRARLHACVRGWGTTSMDSPKAKFICPDCAPKHREYSPGLPFKQSAFTDIARSAGIKR